MRRSAYLLLVALVFACGKEGGGDTAAAHALLDEYVEMMRAVGQAAGVDAIGPSLAEQEQKAAKLLEAKAVSAAFVARHDRLVRVTRALVTPGADQAEIDAFLDAIEGPKADRDPGGGMAAVAPAIVEEILNLHMLLDGTTDRSAAREKYLKKYSL
jgi:hypothetical protein